MSVISLAGPWSWSYQLDAIGRATAMVPVSSVKPLLARKGGRLEYRREGLVEWYVNTIHGMENGFDIAARPAGNGPLVIAGRVGQKVTALMKDGGQTVVFEHNGVHAFTFSGIVVTDSKGASFPGVLDWEPGMLRIIVNDTGAVYPLTVDPHTGSCPSHWCSDGDASTWDICTKHGKDKSCAHEFDPAFEGKTCQWGNFCCPNGQYHATCKDHSGGGDCPSDWCNDGDPSTQDICKNYNKQAESFDCDYPFDPKSEGQMCNWGKFCCNDGKIHENCDMSCKSDKECSDGDACTTDLCKGPSGCVHQPVGDGKPCDDGDACTTNDTCSKGQCSGKGQSCDDGDPCTKDSCNKAGKCVNTPVSGGKCDDGDDCTTNDMCDKGVCVGKGQSCDDGDPCTKDSCGKGGKCVNTPLTGPKCDDGDDCTTNDTCDKGVCAGSGQSCDDGNPCTKDSCDKHGKCVNTPLSGIPCDDEDGCTNDDSCWQGECTGKGKSCDDGNDCTKDGCDEWGQCVNTPLSTTPCDDGDECTVDDVCSKGVCGGAPANCDDGDPCTQDVCTKLGCAHLPLDSGSCDDGDACTESDKCQAGQCVGTPVTCNDDNPCTTDVCTKGGCAYLPALGLPCDDGNNCTDDACNAAGECEGTDNGNCGKDTCKQVICDPTGKCTTLIAPDFYPCDDGDACTTGDQCLDGVCAHKNETECVSTTCTPASCDPQTGECVEKPLQDGSACETDGNPCTVDQCIDGKCDHDEELPNWAKCDDESACTQGEKCLFGECVAALVVVCPEVANTPCHTAPTCNDQTGQCESQPLCPEVPCQVLTGCDLETGECLYQPLDCDDGNDCTAEACNEKTGQCQVHSFLTGTPCSDGDECTVDDICNWGNCLPGAPTHCDDGQQCTDSQCDPNTGNCIHPPSTKGESCDDGNLCTKGDFCKHGDCVPAFEVVCQGSKNLCEQHECIPETGECASSLPCDDDNPCTIDCDPSVGFDKVCPPKQEVDCDDNDPCTVDSCNPDTGQCEYAPLCFDDDECTQDKCKKGICSYPLEPQGTKCDDGDACTLDDACSANGDCLPDAIKSCDDGKPTTMDMCDPADGSCSHSSFVAQGNFSGPQTFTAVEDGQPVADWYSYGFPNGASANTGLERSNSVVVTLYKEPNGDVYLVVLVDESFDGSGGALQGVLTGAFGAALVVSDDAGEVSMDGGTGVGVFGWNWVPCCTDGTVIGPLAPGFEVVLDFGAAAGLPGDVWLYDANTTAHYLTAPALGHVTITHVIN